MARTDRILRPFWLHQSAEYLIGLVLVAMGLQSLEPAIPTIAGGLVIVNAALADGPLGAFRAFSRRAHRVADVVVIALLALGAVLPWLDVDGTSRMLLGSGAAILAVIWWNSAFEPRRARNGRGVTGATGATATAAPGADRSEAFGRGAGRVAGSIAKAVRDRSRST